MVVEQVVDVRSGKAVVQVVQARTKTRSGSRCGAEGFDQCMLHPDHHLVLVVEEDVVLHLVLQPQDEQVRRPAYQPETQEVVWPVTRMIALWPVLALALELEHDLVLDVKSDV